VRESTGGFPEGLFGALNTNSVGLFDECLAVRAPDFQGQYCTAYFYPGQVPNEVHEKRAPSSERSNWLNWFQLIELYLNVNGTLMEVDPQVSDTTYTTIFLPSVGVCIPSSCTANDFRQSIAQLVGGFALDNQSVVTATDERNCYVDNRQSPSFDGPDIAVL
jgi:Nose resistant-to-fluoxetine protein, N-terminal domain